MGYVPPLSPMRLEGLHCPCCGSEDVVRVVDFWMLFDCSDRRECKVCGFRTRKVERWYRGPFLTMWVGEL